MTRCRFKGWLIALPSVLTLVAWLAPAPATPSPSLGGLRAEIKEVAKKVDSFLQGRGERSVAVGAFTGSFHLRRASAGPGIGDILADELSALKVKITEDAGLELAGRYQDFTDPQNGLLCIKLEGELRDRSGAKLLEFTRLVHGTPDIAHLSGTPVALDPGADVKKRNETLKARLEKPRVHIAGAQVFADPGSPFGVELLVGPTAEGPFKSRPAAEDKGLAFVPVRRDEYYRIRLVNKAPYEAAATLTIDGLDSFRFTTVRGPDGKPRYTHWIIPAGQSIVVRGWHRTNAKADSFLVSAYAESAAGRLHVTDKIGTITAAFHAAWPKGGRPPVDEGMNPTADDYARSADATAQGPPVDQRVEVLEREFGAVRAVVSVRYSR